MFGPSNYEMGICDNCLGMDQGDSGLCPECGECKEGCCLCTGVGMTLPFETNNIGTGKQLEEAEAKLERIKMIAFSGTIHSRPQEWLNALTAIVQEFE